MKIEVDIKGLAELKAKLKGFSDRRLNAALATALTRTAAEAWKAGRTSLSASIARPTPYTVRALKYVGARADRLSAHVGFDVEARQDISGKTTGFSRGGDTPAAKYMLPNVEGGSRRQKRFELALQAKGAMPKGWSAVPGAGARIDSFGNISRGQIAQIISQLGTELLRGYDNTPKSIKAKRAGQRKAGGQFIAVLPGGRSKLKPGVYQRETIGSNLTPVLIYVRTTTYRRRFDFYGDMQRVVDARLQPNVQRAIDEQIERLSRGGAR